MMDEELWQELSSRLDHIEQYLAGLGRVAGFRYTPYGTGPGDPAFDTAASFGQAMGGPGGPPPVPPELVAMAQSGKAIQAIKLYRDMTGMRLNDAKYAVEQAAGLAGGRPRRL